MSSCPQKKKGRKKRNEKKPSIDSVDLPKKSQNNPEIKMGLMFLHEEAPTTFQHFLKWAYNKYGGRNLRAPINQLEEHFRNMTRTDLLRLYILADKFHASLLQNEIVALFHDRLARGYKGIANLGVDEAFLKHLGWHLASNTQLFKLLARALAFRMATNPYHSLPFRRDPLNRPHHAGVHHPYPSEMSKSVMRCAAMLIPERLLRAMNENFFDLNAVPLLNEFGREVGALEKFLVAETGGNSNNN